MNTNPALIAVLENRLQQLLESRPPKDALASEKINYANRLRQARLKLARATGGSHTSAEWEAIVAETGGICVRCGYQHDLAVERPCKAFIRPIAAGGSCLASNLMPLCNSCTVSRGAEMIDWLDLWRKNRLTAVDGS